MKVESFQSLNEYTLENSNKIFEADSDSFSGNLIDKGASFVPRLIRFQKAKKTMAKALNGYIKKSTKVINVFSKSLSKKVDVINKQYSKMVEEKIKPLAEDGNTVQAAKMMSQFLKELEHYRDQQIQQLDKSIENIYNAYNAAIEKRIQTPGFVLNVELSEKGKGELSAKWQELSGIAKMKIDEKKEQIMSNEGWRHLDNIISEVSSFVDENSNTFGDLEFKILYTRHVKNDLYFVKVHLRNSGKRLTPLEKGVIIAEKSEDLELGNSKATKHQQKGTYQQNLNAWDFTISIPNTNGYIMPYLLVKQSKNPIYGESVSIETSLQDWEEAKGQKLKISKAEDEEAKKKAITNINPLVKDPSKG